MKKNMQFADGSIREVSIIIAGTYKHISTGKNEYLIKWCEGNEDTKTASIIKVDEEWMIKENELSADDYLAEAYNFDIIDELPNIIKRHDASTIAYGVPPMTTHPLEDYAANKQQLIDFLQFIKRWYPFEDAGVVEQVDCVIRFVINSSTQWPIEQLYQLIPTGDIPGMLDLNDLLEPDNIRLILNGILNHLHTNKSDEILIAPRKYHVDNPHYQSHNIENLRFIKTSPITNKSQKRALKPRRNYYVTYREDIISDAVQNKNPRDIYKKTKVYTCSTTTSERLPISSETMVVTFAPASNVGSEFPNALKEYIKRASDFELTFNQWFFPPLEIDVGDRIDVFHIVACNNGHKFNAMINESMYDFEAYYSSNNDAVFASDGIKTTIPVSELFKQAVTGRIEMKVFSYDDNSGVTFKKASDSVETRPRRNVN